MSITCHNYEQQVCRLQTQIKDSAAKLSAYDSELTGARTDFGELNSQLDSRDTQLAVLQKQLETNSKQHAEMKAALQNQIQELNRLLTQRKETLDAVTEEKTQFEKLLAAKEAAIVEMTKTRGSLERELDSVRKALASEKAARDTDSGESIEAKELLIAQKLHLQHDTDTLRAERDKYLALSKQMETDSVNEQARHRVELIKLQNSLSAAEDEAALSNNKLSSAEARFRMDVQALKDHIEQQRGGIDDRQKKIDTMTQENNRLHGDITELDAALGNLKDERKQLLTRCLQSEEDAEMLQGKVVALRRQVDDTQSALHELGQLNQSLQASKTRQSERHWEDDSNVPNCNRCRTKFSMTVRRHHCRGCGTIFCQGCTSKTARTPHSKKPVRVCDSCFKDLTS